MKTTVRKAVGAGIGAAATGFGTALLDGQITGSESLVSLGLGVLASAAVWKLKYQVPAG